MLGTSNSIQTRVSDASHFIAIPYGQHLAPTTLPKLLGDTVHWLSPYGEGVSKSGQGTDFPSTKLLCEATNCEKSSCGAQIYRTPVREEPTGLEALGSPSY